MSLEKDYNAELYHYGVKGMKWGHRKAVPTSGRDTRSNNANNASDSDVALREARKAKVKKSS